MITENSPINQNDEDAESGKSDEGEIYQINSVKSVLPQIFAGTVTSLFNFLIGMGFSFSGVLIPSLEDSDSEYKTSSSEISWIASAPSLAMVVGSIFTGYLQEKFGRLTLARSSLYPMLIGWFIIAVAPAVKFILIGRILIGLTTATIVQPGGLYIAEICWPSVRNLMLALPCLTSTTGIAFIYLEKFVMEWKTIAWSSALCTTLLIPLTYIIPESPLWLLNKNRIEECKKSLNWLNRYENKNNSENQLRLLKKDWNVKQNNQGCRRSRKEWIVYFRKPSTYKPIIIIIVLALVQSFSGIYVIMAYAINFMESIGSDIDPLVASNIIIGSKIFTAVGTMVILKYIGRKSLFIFSCLGITTSLYVSALFTKWIQEGTTDHKLIPIVCLFIYMNLTTLGLEPLPWIIGNEIMPMEIRSYASGLLMFIICCFMFISIQSYRSLNDYLGGAVYMQVFYGTFTMLGAVYVYFWVPETARKSYSDIVKDFEREATSK